MDLESFFSRLTETINKNRPAEPEPVVFVSPDENEQKVVPNRSPRWQRSTKRTVIIGLVILSLIALFFLRNMITPLLLSWLMVFYLKPLVISVRKKLHVSHKWAVVIIFGSGPVSIRRTMASVFVSMTATADGSCALMSNVRR